MSDITVQGDNSTRVIVGTDSSEVTIQGTNAVEVVVNDLPSIEFVVDGALRGPQGLPGLVQSVVAGANIVVDSTDPAYPKVTATAQPLVIKDEGTSLTSTPASLNFAGVGVVATVDGSNNVTVEVDATPPPDASPTVKGLIQLAGDLGGTAASPTVPGLTTKVPVTRTVNGHALSADVTVTKSDVGLGSVDNTADAAKAVLSATKLTTARTIDGITFDGTANITVIAPATHAATTKTTPADADELPITDSAASFALKNLTWANLKAAIKSYYDTVTSTMTNKTLTGGLVTADPSVALGIASKQYVDTQATSSSFVPNEVPAGLVNGSNTAFTTASNMATGSLRVHRNGLRLKGGGVDFTQGANNAFTFVTAPNTGDTIVVDYNVSSTGFSVGTNSTLSSEVPTGLVNSSNTSFTVLHGSYIAGSLEVYLNGVHQTRGTDYTETTPGSGIFTMAAAPITGQTITCNYQFNLNPSSNADTVDGIHANSTATANQLYPLDSNGKVSQSVLYDQTDRFRDYIQPATGVVAISSGLIGTFSNIVYYIGGNRYTKTGIPNKTYTASKDTYVDIDTTGTVTYTEVANNAASPALAANSVRVAVVVTGASISYIHQGKMEFTAASSGASSARMAISDGKGNAIYPAPNQKTVAGMVRPFASTTGQPGATSVAYNGINNIPFQAQANTNYKLKFYEPVISGITLNGVWVFETYLSASVGAYTTRLDEIQFVMFTNGNGIYFELDFNSGTYSGLTYLEIKLRSATTTGTATINGDTSTRMGRFTIELA